MHQRGALAGQVAVVTGAGRGIGAAIRHHPRGSGRHVVLCGRTHAPLEATSSLLIGVVAKVSAIACDVSGRSAHHVESRKTGRQKFGRLVF